MARVIGPRNPGNSGEGLFVARAEAYLDDASIIYWNRQVLGREFDVCILLPERGILVVELKGWREESILRIENDEAVVIRTPEGELAASPQRQARGYRFDLERHIRSNTGRFPLVFQMVGLPQVSGAFFRSKRMDVVMEERFTFLREDLADKAAFFGKLDQALREVVKWRRDPFDARAMLEVRRLFEANVPEDGAEADDVAQEGPAEALEPDYSRLYYLPGREIDEAAIHEMVEQYMRGCKLYCVFGDGAQLRAAAERIDGALARQGLRRNRGDIEIDLDGGGEHLPRIERGQAAFTGFHCEMSVLREPFDAGVLPFVIRNGRLAAGQERILRQLGELCAFNPEQYLLEHADPEKNIVVRASAGTGKTHAMIARIAFVCHSQRVPLLQMAERIVMLTFTNEAADQMAERLKAYFRNCYLLSSRTEYLDMVLRIGSMQISTIHAYAKRLIARLGASCGYGVDVGIVSGDYRRRRKVEDVLDAHIRMKRRTCGAEYIDRLGMPIYAIRDLVLDFIGRLNGKGVDLQSIEAADFGRPVPEGSHRELHALLAEVIPAVERAYQRELLEDNRIHLGAMTAILKRIVCDPGSEAQIRALKRDGDAMQFMFVDEFQDTDDAQIAFLRRMAAVMDCRLFVVGDVKQCIYRFRGAREEAFDQLGIGAHPDEWLEFSLRKNYRTDAALLRLFDRSFSNWGGDKDALLSYDPAKDGPMGTRDYNGYIRTKQDRYYRRLRVASNGLRMQALAREIRRIRARIQYEEQQRHMQLSPVERSIAILVRENWQAELVRTECARLLPDVRIETNTGGDLYMSQPALDLMTLLNALVHFDVAEDLYNLATSNFFGMDVPKSRLYNIRMRSRAEDAGERAAGREQAAYLTGLLNRVLVDAPGLDADWEGIVSSLRTKPVLQLIRRIYDALQPWRNESDDPWKQRCYQMNVDLLLEQTVKACNVDRLTISTMQAQLRNCILAQPSVDSRVPASDAGEAPIRCLTVHKAKGLEYGHVILPFCSAPMDAINPEQLQVSVRRDCGRCRIGYSLCAGESGEVLQNDAYNAAMEADERRREEARILYVAMTRAIRSFSWIEIEGKRQLAWQNLIEAED